MTPILFTGENVRKILDGTKTQTRRVLSVRALHGMMREEDCPYGVPGDRLWVRETWCQDERGGTLSSGHAMVYYRADMPTQNIWKGSWRPSIFMPRWASRITLEIANIRVERLQDISEADAKEEGCQKGCQIREVLYADEPREAYSYIEQYRKLWDSINGKTYPWDHNPWVWAITFTLIKKPA